MPNFKVYYSISNSISFNLHMFLVGFIDSISIYRTFPLLVKSKTIATTTVKIIGANGFLLLGSIIMFEKVIKPIISSTRSAFVASNDLLLNGHTENQRDIVLSALFYSLFIVPIYILCYVTSMAGYQTIADELYQNKTELAVSSSNVPIADMKTDTNTAIPNTIVDGTYATVAWVFLFLQLKLLTSLMPLLFAQLIKMLDWLIVLQIHDSLSTSFALKSFMLLSLNVGKILCECLGMVLMTAMYSWYCFDFWW